MDVATSCGLDSGPRRRGGKPARHAAQRRTRALVHHQPRRRAQPNAGVENVYAVILFGVEAVEISQLCSYTRRSGLPVMSVEPCEPADGAGLLERVHAVPHPERVAPARTWAASDLRDITASSCSVVASPPLSANTSLMNTLRCSVPAVLAANSPLWTLGPPDAKVPDTPCVRGLLRLLAQKGTTGSRCSRSRPAAPRHRWPGRSPGCSTDPRRTGSCTPRPVLPRWAAPGCCGSG